MIEESEFQQSRCLDFEPGKAGGEAAPAKSRGDAAGFKGQDENRLFNDIRYIRLSKLMSERGICSRREADHYIENGQVEVNGEIISTLGTKVMPNARVRLRSEARRLQENKVTILLNKPVGFVSSQPEKGYREALELITPENRFGNDQPFVRCKMGVGGRLDIDSRGLLVFSQDGAVIKHLIGPDSKVEKEYIVYVEGGITHEKIKRLRVGLSLDGKPLKRAKIDLLPGNALRFVLREGKKRQIRRMCELVDLNVTGLKRVRIGKVRLGKLPEGMWRFLEEGEVF